MGWIETIRSLLGLQSNGHRETGDVEVTVEKEPDASSERAVKEPSDGDIVERDDTTEGDDEPLDGEEEPLEQTAEPDADEAAFDQDAEEVATSAVDDADESEPEFVEESEAEADEETETEATEEPEVETDDEGETEAGDDSATEESATDPAETVELTDIKGIGSAYADRLRAASVENGADLAAADATELSAETDISEKRLQRWIDRATER